MEKATAPFTRRRFVQVLGGLTLAAVPAGRFAGDAAAGRGWCRVDPVVRINGRIADIRLSSDRRLLETALGPAEIVVRLPVGMASELLAVDRGFGGHGYIVTFVPDVALPSSNGRFSVGVDVYVPSSDGSLPLVVNFAPRSSGLEADRAQGLVNTYWISLQPTGTTSVASDNDRDDDQDDDEDDD